jgi:uncharacterized BrkB/YihY/UPF0761 family membrane protein
MSAAGEPAASPPPPEPTAEQQLEPEATDAAAEPSASAEAAPPAADDERLTGLQGLMAFGKGRYAAGRTFATDLLERHRNRPLVDLSMRFYERDRAAAGSVVSSAIAFRLFLFFVPMLLFVVGIFGLFANVVSSKDVSDAGVTGTLAVQINTALSQPSSTRWIAIGAGLIGMLTTGRTLSKALAGASCLAWGIPVRPKASVRVVGGVIGLLVGMGVVIAVVSRIRQSLGLAVTGVSFVAVLAIYVVVAMVLASLLPRGTTDPGALLPGAVVVAVTLTALQVFSQFYLPDRFDRASQLYGAIGATIVTLGWFFFAGRALVLAMVLDAVIFERFGSITGFVFALPVLRELPRRWAWFRRYFDLEEATEVPDRAADDG